MPLNLKDAKTHVGRFELRHNIGNVASNDRGVCTKNDSFCGHYSVGSPMYASPHYSGSSLFDKGRNVAIWEQTLRIQDKGSGLWFRNTNCLSYAMAAMGDILDEHGQRVGIYRPELPQILLFAYAIAATAGCLGIPLGTLEAPATVTKQKMATDEYNNRIWPVEGEYIQAPTYEDHCWYAHQDDYWPERTDIGPYNGTTKVLIHQFHDWMTAGDLPNRFVGFLQ